MKCQTGHFIHIFKMIEEVLISNATAKLANKAGIKNLHNNGKVCTQSLLQKILRDKYKIVISVGHSTFS